MQALKNTPKYMKHLFTGNELLADELEEIFSLAQAMKTNPQSYRTVLSGKSAVLLFDKPSLRTKLSFSLAVQSLGGLCVESLSNTRKHEEHADVIRVLNGYCDFLIIRTHDDVLFDEMSVHANMPIINGLSALYHPCQILADLFSLKQHFGNLDGLSLAYVGDGNNILHSLMMIAPKVGIQLKYCCPKNHQPKLSMTAISSKYRNFVEAHDTPESAVARTHAVYTDVWTSMGFEANNYEKNFEGFQVNESLMSLARPNAVFMHCMPMERGKEVSPSLPDTPASMIFSQSENRLHVQKALLMLLDAMR